MFVLTRPTTHAPPHPQHTHLQTNADGMIDYEEFKTINRRYPMMLFPAFRLQDSIRKKTLGSCASFHGGCGHVCSLAPIAYPPPPHPLPLGNRAWNAVLNNVTRIQGYLEFQRVHDGALPREPYWRKLRRALLGCVIHDPDPIKLVRRYRVYKLEQQRRENARRARMAQLDAAVSASTRRKSMSRKDGLPPMVP